MKIVNQSFCATCSGLCMMYHCYYEWSLISVIFCCPIILISTRKRPVAITSVTLSFSKPNMGNVIAMDACTPKLFYYNKRWPLKKVSLEQIGEHSIIKLRSPVSSAQLPPYLAFPRSPFSWL